MCCTFHPRQRGKRKQGLLMHTCAHTHTGAHVSSLKHIFRFLLHTCRTQKHSHRHLYVHSLPKHQCTHSYAHTPSYTNTQILAAHIQVHTHTCVHLCTPVTLYTHMNTHRAQLYAHTHKSVFTYALISQVHPGSHASPYPVNKTYIYKYM